MRSPRTLTTRELNRAVLARQLLLQRTNLPLARALERVGGLQAQYAPSMYIGLWSRLKVFERGQLDRALARRTIVQATLMRSTIHLVSARDYWPLALAVAEGRRRWWLRAVRDRPAEEEIVEAANLLRDQIAAGPMRRSEIEKLIGKRLFDGVRLWLNLVRVPPSGTWERRRADLFAAAEEWLGAPGVNRQVAAEHLVRRYLGAFGPAPVVDIAGWAGIPTAEIEPALGSLPLRHFRHEHGAELVDLPRAPIPDAATAAPPRFLPTWDATLLVHARRTAILPEEYRPRIFNTKNPQSVPTFLLDGAVAGTWRFERGRVVLEPFEPVPAAVRRTLAEEGERLTALHRLRPSG